MSEPSHAPLQAKGRLEARITEIDGAIEAYSKPKVLVAADA